jgi:hypothetical protein
MLLPHIQYPARLSQIFETTKIRVVVGAEVSMEFCDIPTSGPLWLTACTFEYDVAIYIYPFPFSVRFLCIFSLAVVMFS